jgi:hypothetical protein
MALEFTKAWYPDVSMAQLATFRQEARPELELEREAIAIQASALAEYTDDNIFIPERGEDGAEVPPSWYGLDPNAEEDSAEEIASSDEAKKEGQDGDGNDVVPDDGATSQSQLDPAPADDQQATSPVATAD